MTNKNIFLLGLAAALAMVYAVYFTDWFRPKTVKIFHVDRTLRVRATHAGAPARTIPVLIFGLNRVLKLTEVKVVEADDFKTNRNALPVWHLVSDSNSVALTEFRYGQAIPGMKAAVKGVRPEPLETNVPYLLLLAAGKVKGEHDFMISNPPGSAHSP